MQLALQICSAKLEVRVYNPNSVSFTSAYVQHFPGGFPVAN